MLYTFEPTDADEAAGIKGIHPLAQVIPINRLEEYNALYNDIKSHGLRLPVIVDRDGMILDGRLRRSACIELELPIRAITTDGDPCELIYSLNLCRRHIGRERGHLRYELYRKANSDQDDVTFTTHMLSKTGPFAP